MKIISFQDIVELNIPMRTCYDWVDKVIMQKRNSLLPAKIHMNMQDNRFCNIMPSVVYNVNGKNFGGVKIVTRYPEREPALDSTILLFDADTGDNLALLDGNWITAMRTGAVATHSIIHFAKKTYSTIGIIGLGNTARSTMLTLAEMVKDQELDIALLKYKNQADLFIDRFKSYSNLHFRIVDNVRDIVQNSDVILSCATYFEDDLCQDSWFKEGVLVVPVHTRGFTNCDLFFDKVYADDTSHVSHFKNFSKFKYYSEVCDVMNGIRLGRESDEERIITYNIGISVHDIFYAANVFTMLEQKSDVFMNLKTIDFCSPKEKFWI